MAVSQEEKSHGTPHTYATFVSQSGVSALDWFPNSDRKFIYGTMTGNIRICDKDERKSASDFNLYDQNGGNGSSGNGSQYFVNQIVCSNTGNLCAIAHSKCLKGVKTEWVQVWTNSIHFVTHAVKSRQVYQHC